MEKKNYYVSKSKKKKEVVYLEYDKISGYEVNPKIKQKGSIDVSKIIFVNPDFSEKVIRKKIDNKINKLLAAIHEIDENDNNDSGANHGTIQRNLMAAEKLRIQIINNYTKYLGHTYENLTLEKIKIIVQELRFRLFQTMIKNEQNEYEEERESHRGR